MIVLMMLFDVKSMSIVTAIRFFCQIQMVPRGSPSPAGAAAGADVCGREGEEVPPGEPVHVHRHEQRARRPDGGPAAVSFSARCLGSVATVCQA